MASTGQEQFYFKINKGLYTEGGYLDTPVEAWRDAENVVPNLDGSVQRRKGIDYELDYTVTTSVTDSVHNEQAFVVEHWNSVGGDGSRNFIVVQKGATIEFYDNVGDGVGASRRPFTIDLTSYKPSTNPNTIGTSPIQTVSGNGRLVIVSQDSEPLLVEFDDSTNTITVTQLDIKIRDFAGLQSTESGSPISVTTNPNVLDASHNYNLLNQGWLAAHITSYDSAIGLFPDNTQQWTVGKDSTDTFTPALLDKHDFGTSPAPRGRFILDLFNRNYSGVSGIGGITTLTERYRPTTTAFFAGRIWYAGINSENFSTWVLFSRVATSADEFEQCHQVNDPTAEILSDLLDSDGGVIPIQDAGSIVKLAPLGNGMVVFADNGVWQIISGENGFTASSYSVHKISSIGCISAQSVVLVEDTLMFCGNGGIYALTYSDSAGSISSGAFSVKSISDATIKSKYEEIVPNARPFIRAVYNEEDQVVHFAFSSDPDHSATIDRFCKDTLLSFDARTQAWYISKFYDLTEDQVDAYTLEGTAVKTPCVYDLWLSKGRSSITADFQVIESDLDTVVDSSGDNVVIRSSIDATRDRTLKFWASKFHRHSGRGTYGTRINSAGLLTEVPFQRERHNHDLPGLGYAGVLAEGATTNLALDSEEFSSANWSASNASVTRNSVASPDGTTTADTLVEDATASSTHYVSQAITWTAVEHTITVYAKAGTRSWFALFATDGVTGRRAYFDVTNGVVGALTNATASIESLPGGWYRCTMVSSSAFSAAAGSVAVRLANADSGDTYNGDGSSGLYIWGLMAQTGTSATSYVPTRNLISYSEDFSNAAWAKTDITVSANDAEAPNEATTADKLTEGTAGTAVVSHTYTLCDPNVTSTFSFYIKRSATVTWLKASIYETAASTNRVDGWFRIDDGNEAAGSVSNGGTGTGAAITITPVEDRDGLTHRKWFRVQLTGAVNNSATAVTASIQSADADASSTRLNNSAYLLWGAMAETRASSVGYWPTTSVLTCTKEADSQRDYWQFVAADWHNARSDPSKWYDWYSADSNRLVGAAWIPFIESGYELRVNAGVRRLQAPVIYTFTLRTEEGLDEVGAALSENSVFLQTRWDWSDGTRANKWSPAEQQYRPRIAYLGAGPFDGTLSDFPVVQAKSRTRGSGKAIQFRYYGEANKHFSLLGWGVGYQTTTPQG